MTKHLEDVPLGNTGRTTTFDACGVTVIIAGNQVQIPAWSVAFIFALVPFKKVGIHHFSPQLQVKW